MRPTWPIQLPFMMDRELPDDDVGNSEIRRVFHLRFSHNGYLSKVAHA